LWRGTFFLKKGVVQTKGRGGEFKEKGREVTYHYLGYREEKIIDEQQIEQKRRGARQPF